MTPPQFLPVQMAAPRMPPPIQPRAPAPRPEEPIAPEEELGPEAAEELVPEPAAAPEAEPETAPEAAPEAEGDVAEGELPEYIEDLPFEVDEEGAEAETLLDEMGDLAALPEEAPLSLDEEVEDIWGEPEAGLPLDEELPAQAEPLGEAEPEVEPEAGSEIEPAEEPAPSAEAPAPEATLLAAATAAAPALGMPSPKRAGSLLGEPAARLLEYLRDLSGDLPEDKREEFAASGLKEKMEGLIERLKSDLGAIKAPPPIGLLAAAGEAKRRFDPRRSPEGRRSGRERRAVPDRRDGPDRRSWVERRYTDDRRAGEDRRVEDRRSPPPVFDLPPTIPPSVASVKAAPDGTPTEIAGMAVSPRLARLIAIIRREKADGRS